MCAYKRCIKIRKVGDEVLREEKGFSPKNRIQKGKHGNRKEIDRAWYGVQSLLTKTEEKDIVPVSQLPFVRPDYSSFRSERGYRRWARKMELETRGIQPLCLRCKWHCKVLSGVNSEFTCFVFEEKEKVEEHG
jgi:hypothetical protein